MKSMSLPLSVPVEHADSAIRPEEQPAAQEDIPYETYEKYQQTDTLFLLPEEYQVSPFKRFLILLPNENFSAPDLFLALSRYTAPGISLLFVTRVTDPEIEPSVRRQVLILENMAHSSRLQSQSYCISEGSWSHVIQEMWRVGDLVICLEDHKVPSLLIGSTSIGRKIAAQLNVPVLIHRGIHTWEPAPFQKTIRDIMASVSFLVAILMFTLLEIKIDQALDGWAGRIVLILTVLVEFFFIWKINEFFG